MENDELLDVCKQSLDILQHIHNEHVIHRDIKPENILFESHQEGSAVKIIDFGLSRMHDEKREAPMGNAVGTAYYMSPMMRFIMQRDGVIYSLNVKYGAVYHT